MAYEALIGVVHMRHKSMRHFTEILVGALQRDYNVETVVTAFVPPVVPLDHSKKSIKEKRADDLARADAVRECYDVISDRQFTKLEERLKTSPEGLEDEQLQQLHVFGMVVRRYAVDPALCDVPFYAAYVQTCFNNEGDKMKKQFYAFQRFHAAWQVSADELNVKFKKLLDKIRGEKESIMALYNTKLHEFYKPAMTVSRLLDLLVPGWRARVRDREPIEVRIGDCAKAVAAWTSALSDSAYDQLIKLLGIVKNEGRDEASTRTRLHSAMTSGTPGKNATKTASQMVDRVLQATFGVPLGKRRGRDPRCDIDVTLYQALVDKYKCGCFTRVAADVNPFTEFAMVDEDELSCHKDPIVFE